MNETRRPIAATTVKNALVVVCDDGTAWMWAQNPEKIRQLSEHDRARVEMGVAAVEYTWVQFHTPIPGTRSDAVYQEASR